MAKSGYPLPVSILPSLNTLPAGGPDQTSPVEGWTFTKPCGIFIVLNVVEYLLESSDVFATKLNSPPTPSSNLLP